MRTYFFDTEFTGLRKDTTLISIGIVSDMKVVKAVNGKGKGKYVFIE